MRGPIKCLRIYPLVAVALAATVVNADGFEEIDCATMRSQAKSCSACFETTAGVSEAKKFYDVFNTGDQDVLYFARDNFEKFSYEILNRDTRWTISVDLIGYADGLPWNTVPKGAKASTLKVEPGVNFLYLLEGSSHKIYETRDGAGIEMMSAAVSAFDDEPDLKFTFRHKYRTFDSYSDGNPVFSYLKENNSCIFVRAVRYGAD